MFITISPFLVIDDNTIKASIKFARIDKFNHLHSLECLPPSNDGLASPKTMIPPLCLPLFATPLSYVDLIHLVFLPLWNTFPSWEHLSPFVGNMPCFGLHLSPFEIKSPKGSCT